jgi:hypothetical protein
MAKNKKSEETETSTTPSSLNPDQLIVKQALAGMREFAHDTLAGLVSAGEGSYLKRLPSDESRWGKAVLHEIRTAANRKKGDFQPDHRTVASAVKCGFLIPEKDGEGALTGKFFLNENVRPALQAIFAAA